ncbi:lipopolysaccharide biosynthesis protein [Providencia rettgeri]|uniref:lipopolysaccharide biosynthesis protein n=1 Tax=Providencia sp. PROV247 TaxID=2949938 RepID=UPI00234B9338|nr:hypothetical protein [Providencia sp. PROV247]
MKNLYNTLLRIFAISSKFILALYITKVFGLDIMGMYGITISIISFIVYLSGAELYAVLTPKYSNHHKKNSFYFSNQIFFSFISCLLLTLVTIIFIEKNNFIYLIFFVAVVESISQEIYRLLLIRGNSLAANILFFIKNGTWPYLALICYYTFDIKNPIELLLAIWFFCDLIGIFVYINFLKKKNSITVSIRKVNLKFLTCCIPKLIPVFSGSIIMRCIVTLDKLILSYFTTLSNVGIYSFFFSICNALQALIDAGYISSSYKKIITLSVNKKFRDFRKIILNLMIISILLMFPTTILSYVFFVIFKFNDYKDNIFLLVLILISTFFLSANNVTKLFLISSKKLKLILVSSLIAFLSFSTLCLLLFFNIGSPITVMSINITTSSMSYFFISMFFIKRLSKNG